MNCAEFRRAIGADPNLSTAETLAHRAVCPACEQYAQESLRLNGLIKRALEVPVPVVKQFATPKKAHVLGIQPRWYAMAASAVLMIGLIAGILSLGTPRDSLAADVVNHFAHEPDAMTVTEARVASELLDGALRAKGLHVLTPMTDVSYLQSCLLRGHFVPHLIVQTSQGPVTVMLLTEEKIDAIEHFEDHQYRGLLMPTAKGGIAVIATDTALAEQVANKVKATIAWE